MTGLSVGSITFACNAASCPRPTSPSRKRRTLLWRWSPWRGTPGISRSPASLCTWSVARRKHAGLGWCATAVVGTILLPDAVSRKQNVETVRRKGTSPECADPKPWHARRRDHGAQRRVDDQCRRLTCSQTISKSRMTMSPPTHSFICLTKRLTPSW